jgi:hypothetical protein
MFRLRHRWFWDLMAVVALGAAGATSCADDKKGDGPAALPAPVKLNPLSLDVLADNAVRPAPAPREAWALFDRDTGSRWLPTLASGEVVLRVALEAPSDLTHVKVFGPSPYVLDVRADGQALGALSGIDLSTLKTGWNVLRVEGVNKARRVSGPVELRFRAKSADAEAAPLGDVELWGLRSGAPTRVSTESLRKLLAQPSPAFPSELAVSAAEPERATLAADAAMIQTPCAAFAFRLDRPPSLYRAAWLAFRGRGMFRAFALTRALNHAPKKTGHWVAAAGDAQSLFVEPLDPEQLRQGDNRFEVCLPSDAVGTVDVSDVSFLGELEHGTNGVESLAIGPVNAAPTRGASSALDPSSTAAHVVERGERVLVLFERWFSPDALMIRGSAASWSVECLDQAGQGSAFPLDVAHEAKGVRLLVARRPWQERVCAGLSLVPSARAELSQLWVAGSGARRRLDWPRIVLASPAEHFGLDAWVDGWASAPSELGGSVHVDIDGADTGTDAGVFAQLTSRTGDPNVSWPISVTAHFKDATSLTRTFVLEAAADLGLYPGMGPGLVPGASDGLTDQERAERYGTVGQSASAEAAPGSESSVRLGTHVGVDIPAGAVGNGNGAGNGQNVTITVAHLDASELPPLDPGLINVTAPFAHGYEFLPHGQQFNKPVKVLLPYQPNLLPPGYAAEDVETFFFDEDAKRWRKLARDVVDKGSATVKSLTDHFTVMINAVVVAPEHPQVSSFNPTQIKDIQAANPSAKLNLIEPPEASSKGDAVLSYPFEVPPGRGGLGPDVALVYNSSGSNGWVGMGWDVPRRSISVDTRWGVPRYRPGEETETYLLEGEQLVPMAHRNAFVARVAEREFHTRVEGAFRKVVRHGNHPNEYWWEVTDKLGTKFFYGAAFGDGEPDPCATLFTVSGAPGIFEWALREVRDTHGNSIRYHYDHVGVPDCGLEPPRVSGQELYLSRIEYTLEAGADQGPYQVVFLRDDQLNVPSGQRRSDVIVDGRGGFKRTTAERLRRVEVRFANRVVRAWELNYRTGPFFKSLLESVRQFGADNAVFPGNLHTFEYHDEISVSPANPTAAYTGFGTIREWSSDSDGVEADLGLAGDAIGFVGSDRATGLSGVQSASLGGHLYVGFKVGVDPTKGNSVGFKVGFGGTFSNGVLSFLDLDGDGLPDKVFRQGNSVRYRSNLARPGSDSAGFSLGSSGLFTASGLDALLKEESTMFSAGVEAYPLGVLSVIVNNANTLTESSTYFSDVNGDGLPDLVHGNRVLFNEGRKNGVHQFTPHDSAGTPFPIVAGSVPSGVAPDLSDLRAENAGRYPLSDTVRVWNAPYTGRVQITGAVSLSYPRSAADAAREKLDGVRVAIEHDTRAPLEPHASELWSARIQPTDGSAHAPEGVSDVSVTAGQRLFFRVQSVDNGAGDEVTWNPSVQYLDIDAAAVDANGLEERSYGAERDFTLAGRPLETRVPFKGRIRIEGALEKPLTSDDIRVQIKVNGVVAFSEFHARSEAASIPIGRDFDVEPQDAIELYIAVDSAIDVSGLVFSAPPVLRYLSAEDDKGNPVEVERNGRPIFAVRLPADVDLYGQQHWVDLDGLPAQSPVRPLSAYHIENCRTLEALVTVRINPFLLDPAPVTFTVKTRGSSGTTGERLLKRTFTSSVTNEVLVIEDAPESADLFFEFSARNMAAAGSNVIIACQERYDDDAPSSPPFFVIPIPTSVPNMLRVATPQDRCSEPYRGWSYAGYKGDGDAADLPISSLLCNEPLSGDFVEVDDDDVEPAFDEIENSADFAGDKGGQLKDQVITFLFTPYPGGRPCQTPPGSTLEPPPSCSVPQVDLWGGPDELTYLTGTLGSSSRLGRKDLSLPTQDDLVQGGVQGGTLVPPAIHRLSVSDQFGVAGDLGVGPASFGGSHTEGPAQSELDYMDMNGDGFPDVVSRGPLVYTDPRGALGSADPNPGIGRARESDTTANSVGIGGTVAMTKSDGKGNAAGKGTRPSEGSGTDLQMQPLGLSLSDNAGDSEAKFDLMDVNGDGLPDRIRRTGAGLSVQLNLGYHLAPAEIWPANDTVAINDANSQQTSASVTLGFNIEDYSFAGGLSATRSSNALRERPEGVLGDLTQERGRTLADVNGDGLLDLVEPGDGVLRVAINRGVDFAPFADWRGAGGVPRDPTATDVSLGRGTSVGAGAYFTVFIPFIPCACGLVINPGADGSAAMNRQEMMIQDIDGDGFPDYLTSDADDHIEARLNNTGKTNLLKAVHRPLGGSFELAYARTGNTFEHPQSRWVLSSVEVRDGFPGDGPDVQLTSFHYENGFYDRFEREFYGFRTVTAEEHDTSNCCRPV